MSKVLVLYASQTGNSRGMAKEIASRACERGYAARSLGMEQYKTIEFENEPTIVVVASSTGNGDCPDNGDKFHRYCKRKTTKPFLEGCQFAVLALGDSNYEAFCEVGKQFDKFFDNLGGKRFMKRCDVDEVDGIEETIEPWMEKLWVALKALDAEGGAARVVPTGTPVQPPPTAPASAPANGTAAAVATPPTVGKEGASFPTGASATQSSTSGGDDDELVGRSPARPLLAPIVAARWLTSTTPGGGAIGSEGDRRVLHVEVDVSAGGDAMAFLPGDALGVLPQNEPSLVDSLLKRLDVSPDAPLPPLGDDAPAHLNGCANVREAFAWRVDLGTVSSWPPQPLLRLLLSAPFEGGSPLRSEAEAAVGQRASAAVPGLDRTHQPSYLM